MIAGQRMTTGSVGHDRIFSTPGFAECIFQNDLVAAKGKQIASRRRHGLSACIRRDEIPLERPDVASDYNLEVLKPSVRETLKKGLGAFSDFFFSGVGPAEAIRPDRCVIYAVVGKETRHKIGIATIPRGSKFSRALYGHWLAHKQSPVGRSVTKAFIERAL
jgi:hypothetical protein